MSAWDSFRFLNFALFFMCLLNVPEEGDEGKHKNIKMNVQFRNEYTYPLRIEKKKNDCDIIALYPFENRYSRLSWLLKNLRFFLFPISTSSICLQLFFPRQIKMSQLLSMKIFFKQLIFFWINLLFSNFYFISTCW